MGGSTVPVRADVLAANWAEVTVVKRVVQKARKKVASSVDVTVLPRAETKVAKWAGL